MGVEYEFEGKTKEDAVQKACEKLSLPEDQLKFDVISHGSTGIFGLVGSKKAKIKVRLPEGQKSFQQTKLKRWLRQQKAH